MQLQSQFLHCFLPEPHLTLPIDADPLIGPVLAGGTILCSGHQLPLSAPGGALEVTRLVGDTGVVICRDRGRGSPGRSRCPEMGSEEGDLPLIPADGLMSPWMFLLLARTPQGHRFYRSEGVPV